MICLAAGRIGSMYRHDIFRPPNNRRIDECCSYTYGRLALRARLLKRLDDLGRLLDLIRCGSKDIANHADLRRVNQELANKPERPSTAGITAQPVVVVELRVHSVDRAA